MRINPFGINDKINTLNLAPQSFYACTAMTDDLTLVCFTGHHQAGLLESFASAY